MNRTFRDANYNIIPYDGSPVEWRVAIYGLWIKDEAVLLVKKRDEKLWDLPGGGVKIGEELAQALTRESLEEAGCKLTLTQFLTAQQDWFYHQGEKRFYSSLQLITLATSAQEIGLPSDPAMVPPRWCPLDQLKELGVFPNILKALAEAQKLGVIK